MRYSFILPSSFDPLEFLTTPRLRMRADDARWLMSTIVRKTAHRDTDPWSYVRLHSSILRRIMSPNNIADIVTALERGEAFETAPYYPGVKCKGYRLGRRYLGDRHVRMPATDPRLIERIEQARREQEAEQRSRWQPIHFALHDEQRYLTITDDADGILEGLPVHTRLCQDVLVGHLRRRALPFSVSTTGRVFNAITGLKRELRAPLRIGGERLGSIDIRNAQPALLAMLIGLKCPPNGVNGRETYKHALLELPPLPLPVPIPSPRSDTAEFVSVAASGSLYERLMGDCPALDREFVKKRFLVDVLAKRGRYPSAVERTFRAGFPSVYRIVRSINRDDHAAAIRLLQRLESWRVVEQVAPRLLGRIRFATLHDAIYSWGGALDRVEEAFEVVFAEIGFRLRLKREAAEGGAVAAADKLTEAGR